MNNNYSKDFLKLFQEDTEKIILNEDLLSKIKRDITQWLSIKSQLDRRLELRLKELEKQEKETEGVQQILNLSGPELRELVNSYSQLHRKIKDLQDINDISNHFKNGYRLIERIRELFTNQEIIYSIIYSGQQKDNKNTIYEANLTMEQLLPFLSLTMRDTKIENNRTNLSNSMRIYLSGSMVAKAAAAAVKENQNNLMDILAEIKNPGLWNSLVDFQKNKYKGVFKNDSNYRGNLGNLYEVYTNLIRTDRGGVFNYIGHEEGKQNTLGLASSLLDAAISDSVPFYKGGDYGLTQLKAVLGGSTRGLADVGTIENTLKELLIALSSTSKKELSESIKRIFLPEESKINDEIDKKNREEAIEAIDKIIEEAHLDIE